MGTGDTVRFLHSKVISEIALVTPRPSSFPILVNANQTGQICIDNPAGLPTTLPVGLHRYRGETLLTL
jgi:hypothetical protein